MDFRNNSVMSLALASSHSLEALLHPNVIVPNTQATYCLPCFAFAVEVVVVSLMVGLCGGD